jgi:hypothetical protein
MEPGVISPTRNPEALLPRSQPETEIAVEMEAANRQ